MWAATTNAMDRDGTVILFIPIKMCAAITNYNIYITHQILFIPYKMWAVTTNGRYNNG